MATQIVIPTVGESVSSGVIAAWTVEDGAFVERDATVLELETDKITMEIPAPASGVVRHRAKAGDEVEVGATVGVIEEGEAPAAAPAAAKAEGGPAVAEKAPPAPPPAAEAPRPQPAQPTENGQQRPQPAADGEHNATPLARKIAAEQNVDLSRIVGTGAGGRIREQDVLAAVQARAGGAAPAPSARAAAPSRGAGREVARERMSPMRQRIASRLVEAQHTAAMLTTFNEVDMSAVMALRKKYKEPFGEKHGIGLGFMSFFVKASASALRAFPMINAYIVADEQGKPAIEKHSYADIAIAVAGPKGLVVPVLRDCQDLSFADIEAKIKDFGVRARDGKIELDEMTGGTFTITNGGVFGSLLSTPILNPPQSAILGMHGIKNRPVEDPDKPGNIVLRPMMYLALSYDHRIVDGAEAVQFLVHIKNAIEAPERLLLDL